jgi:hypothetical protein
MKKDGVDIQGFVGNIRSKIDNRKMEPLKPSAILPEKAEKALAGINSIIDAKFSGQEAASSNPIHSATNAITDEAAAILSKMGGVSMVRSSTKEAPGDSDGGEYSGPSMSLQDYNEKYGDKPVSDEELARRDVEFHKNTVTKDNYLNPGYAEVFPILTFDKQLELLGLSKHELAGISDSVVMNGFYERELMIRGKLRICFRSKETDAHLKAVDTVNDPTATRWQLLEKLSLFTLASTISSYGETEFTPLSQIESTKRKNYLIEKAEFIKTIPYGIYQHLLKEALQFDLAINLALSPVGLQNF